jgi:hypothetical protein
MVAVPHFSAKIMMENLGKEAMNYCCVWRQSESIEVNAKHKSRHRIKFDDPKLEAARGKKVDPCQFSGRTNHDIEGQVGSRANFQLLTSAP